MHSWRRSACVTRSLDLHLSRRSFTTTSRVHQVQRIGISRLLQQNAPSDQEVQVNGWIRSVRKQKRIAFAALGDGSTIDSLQAVLKPEQAADLSYGTAVKLTGTWKTSHGSKQSHELQVSSLEILGSNDAESNPLQPKYQTPDFLRTIPHLRARIPANALLLRLRSQLIASITNFFNDEEFIQTHTPVITSSDCEGAGEVFTVSSNNAVASTPPGEKTKGDGGEEVEHFFRTPKYLTVSAQLHLEALAQSVKKVWTLSPTFRAERSETPRHLSEFYMLEAEVAFVEEMGEVMDVVEDMLRAASTNLLDSKVGEELLRLRASPPHPDEVEANASPAIDAETLKKRWQGLAASSWPRITYHEAIAHLQQAAEKEGVHFQFPPTIKEGLQAEHERYLATSLGQGSPVFVTNYPSDQKPFYMSPSSSGEDTVSCFDLLVPDFCELVGGSMRIHDPAELLASMEKKGVKGKELEWYVDLRRYGSVRHGGFGVGFDRLVGYLGGVSNLKDVVGFPRWVGRGDC